MKSRSIHFRLSVWYSVALASGQILFAIAIWTGMRHLLLRDAQQSAEHAIASCATFIGAELREPHVRLSEELEEFSAALAPGMYLRVLNESQGDVVFESNPKFRPQTENSYTSWNGSPYMLLSQQESIHGQQWLLAVAAPLQQSEHYLDSLRLLLLISIPLVVLVAALGGRWLSRRALKPVADMTQAAKTVGAANLSERLPVPRTGDELQHLAETWNSMLGRLEDSLRSLSRFTADASHELRTPLAVIRTTAELAARRDRPAAAYRDALTAVVTESERMTALLDDLLLLARVDAETVQMPKTVFDLVSLTGELCLQLHPIAESKQVAISFLPQSLRATVRGNEPAIRRLILALLDNAVKYSPPTAQVHVLLTQTSQMVSLEVIDAGPGIPQSELPLIFQRFYRGPQSPEGVKEGTGLGLSLAAGLAERNNARIEVVSAVGGGSTFRVLFQPAT